MRATYRHVMWALLVPAIALLWAPAALEAAQAKATRWSDRSSWPGRKLPVAGDKVTIERGKEVILDVSPRHCRA